MFCYCRKKENTLKSYTLEEKKSPIVEMENQIQEHELWGLQLGVPGCLLRTTHMRNEYKTSVTAQMYVSLPKSSEPPSIGRTQNPQQTYQERSSRSRMQDPTLRKMASIRNP